MVVRDWNDINLWQRGTLSEVGVQQPDESQGTMYLKLPVLVFPGSICRISIEGTGTVATYDKDMNFLKSDEIDTSKDFTVDEYTQYVGVQINSSEVDERFYMQITLGDEEGEHFIYGIDSINKCRRRAVKWDEYVLDMAGKAPINHNHDWKDITSGKPSTYPPSSHNHDERYYTETEINTKLAGKLDKNRIQVLTAKVSKDGVTSIPLPEGFTRDNSIVIGFEIESKLYSVKSFETYAGYDDGKYTRIIFSDGLYISAANVTTAFNVRVTLLKVS